MTKKIIVFIIVGCLPFSAYGLNMHTLFEALKKQPITKIDTFVNKSFQASSKKVASMFYPRIYFFGAYEHFNSPTNLRPTTPTESSLLIKENKPLPFSRNIKDIGVEVSLPIVDSSLINITKKAKTMYKSSKVQSRLNLIKNQALIVNLNAKLAYLEHLQTAMILRKQSLQSTLKRVEVGVKNGRMPQIQQIKIESSINQINIKLNEIKSNIVKITSVIKTLTSITLKHAITMKQVRRINKSTLLSIKPLQYTQEASKYDVYAKRSKLLPSIYLKSNIVRKFGRGYNNNQHTLRNYASIGLYMKMPIFDKTIYSDIEKSKAEYWKNESKLKQLAIELSNEAKELENQLKIIDNSIRIEKEELKNQESLLKYAKVAFKNQRMLEEEYLRYETQYLNTQSNLFDFEYQKWNILSKIAVIYGNNLEEIVR